MTTKPHHDHASIATDAAHVVAQARRDEKALAKYLGKHELDELASNIERLRADEGGQSAKLHAQVSAGVHAAEARAPIVAMLRDVRDDAVLLLTDDAHKRAFGFGRKVNAASSEDVRSAAHEVLAAAEAHPKEAAAIHLDHKALHHLEDMLHALDGADAAHVESMHERHAGTASFDSLAHKVSAEVAHVRRIAQRVFRGDESKLAAYASTLPRHKVKPRQPKPAPAPAG